jgi:hypothetical protein
MPLANLFVLAETIGTLMLSRLDLISLQGLVVYPMHLSSAAKQISILNAQTRSS